MKNEVKKEMGKHCLDLAKVLFGGMVLATVMNIENISKIMLIIGGILATLLFTWIGYTLIKNS